MGFPPWESRRRRSAHTGHFWKPFVLKKIVKQDRDVLQTPKTHSRIHQAAAGEDSILCPTLSCETSQSRFVVIYLLVFKCEQGFIARMMNFPSCNKAFQLSMKNAIVHRPCQPGPSRFLLHGPDDDFCLGPQNTESPFCWHLAPNSRLHCKWEMGNG